MRDMNAEMRAAKVIQYISTLNTNRHAEFMVDGDSVFASSRANGNTLIGLTAEGRLLGGPADG